MAADNETFTLESVVRGHHVYKRIWSPRTGHVMEASAETGNPEDRHAVALQQTARRGRHTGAYAQRSFKGLVVLPKTWWLHLL